jgi:hypothetical protein
MGRRAARRGDRLSLGGFLGRNRRARIPVALCIDAEADEREVDLERPGWTGLEQLFDRLPATRRRLERASGAPPRLSWFVRADPQVEVANGSAGWAFSAYRPTWESLIAAGDDVGIHCHAWRRDDRDGGWIADHGDPGWVRRCAELGLGAYREHFGAPPPCYRGGDRFLNDDVVALLERERVGVDATVEPGMPATEKLADDERATGSIPDYTAAPEAVYRPSADDFRRADAGSGDGLMMLPMTAAGGGTLHPWTDPGEFRERLAARLADGAPGHLAFAIRTDLALYDNAWEVLLENMATVCRLLGRRRAAFATATETARAASSTDTS